MIRRRVTSRIFGLVLVGATGVRLGAASRVGLAGERRSPDKEALIDALRGGGHVIFLRHAATDEAQVDTGVLGDRAGQRNLSAAGRAQAAALDDAFRAHDIPIGTILASPVFRARDTAEIAFGAARVRVTMDLVADDYGGSQEMVTATRGLLSRPPAEGNTLLVGHRTPLQLVTGESFPDTILPEGGMAVFEPLGRGFRYVGAITTEELANRDF